MIFKSISSNNVQLFILPFKLDEGIGSNSSIPLIFSQVNFAGIGQGSKNFTVEMIP